VSDFCETVGWGDRFNFIIDVRTPDTRSLNRYPNTTTTNRISASFEQTQRVPTGHPDVCLCDVSGATNYA
jgi:hypothetical protein